MLVLIHVIIALSSLTFATYLLARPSKRKFAVNYALIAATLGSGTYLVVSTGAPVFTACMSGLAYTLFVGMASFLAFVRFCADTSE
jgi:hypothetical protein